MPSPLRIIVADHQPDMQEFYRTMLPQMGYQVVAVVETGISDRKIPRALLKIVVESEPRLVLG